MLAFVLAYPALMAELLIGRHTHRNMVTALESLHEGEPLRSLGRFTGIGGLATASLILSFYAIVAGWMLGSAASYPLEAIGMASVGEWLLTFDLPRNALLMLVLMALTSGVVLGGVEDGIERWSRRLMPLLIVTLIALSGYVLTLEGALTGLQIYLLPDFSKLLSRGLLIDALGSAFFSLSLGVGTMLIYGSYLSDKENIPRVGAQVALVDIGIAVLAGFLILPAMYVADARGVAIFNSSGGLLSEDTLIFTILPALFETMDGIGAALATSFFVLMSIAALTSSISMLEVPVAYLIERHGLTRHRATFLTGACISAFSGLIVLNFGSLFGWVITSIYPLRPATPRHFDLHICRLDLASRRIAQRAQKMIRTPHLAFLAHVPLLCEMALPRYHWRYRLPIDCLKRHGEISLIFCGVLGSLFAIEMLSPVQQAVIQPFTVLLANISTAVIVPLTTRSLRRGAYFVTQPPGLRCRSRPAATASRRQSF